MKPLEILERIAKLRHYGDLYQMLNDNVMDGNFAFLKNRINEAMQEYAKQTAIAQRDRIANNIFNECKSKPLADELHTKILNTPLVTD